MGWYWNAAATEGEKYIAIEVTCIQSVWEKQTRNQQCAINLVSGPLQGVKAASRPVRRKMKREMKQEEGGENFVMRSF